MASRALKINPKKSGTSQPSDFTERIASKAVSEDAIAALAYQLSLRANIAETLLVSLITEQGGKENSA